MRRRRLRTTYGGSNDVFKRRSRSLARSVGSVTNPRNWIHRAVAGVSVADALTANWDVLDRVEVLQTHTHTHTHTQRDRTGLLYSLWCRPICATRIPDAVSTCNDFESPSTDTRITIHHHNSCRWRYVHTGCGAARGAIRHAVAYRAVPRRIRCKRTLKLRSHSKMAASCLYPLISCRRIDVRRLSDSSAHFTALHREEYLRLNLCQHGHRIQCRAVDRRTATQGRRNVFTPGNFWKF